MSTKEWQLVPSYSYLDANPEQWRDERDFVVSAYKHFLEAGQWVDLESMKSLAAPPYDGFSEGAIAMLRSARENMEAVLDQMVGIGALTVREKGLAHELASLEIK